MKTIEKREITPTKIAHIYITSYGEYYVAIEQSYHGDIDVLEARTYKTMSGVERFIGKWHKYL